MNNNFFQLSAELDKYVKFACNSFYKYFRHITYDDLRQECVIKIFEISSQNKYCYSEKKEMCKRAIYNRLKDLYRYEARRIKIPISEEQDDVFMTIVIESSCDILEELVVKDAVFKIRCMLGESERTIFDLLLQPDESLVAIAEEEYNFANDRKKRGILSMNTTTVKITSKNLAQRLNVSPATISRKLERIHQAVLTALSN